MEIQQTTQLIPSDQNYGLALLSYQCNIAVPTTWTELSLAGAPLPDILFSGYRLHRSGKVLALTGLFTIPSWSATPSIQFRVQKRTPTWVTIMTSQVYNADVTDEIFDEVSATATFGAGQRLRTQVRALNETLTVQSFVSLEVESIRSPAQ